MKSFGTFNLIRPDNVPRHWPVFNAPRPLPGSVTWEGDFLRGCHYSAVDPEDEWKQDTMRRIESLDGWQVIEHSECVFLAWLADQCKAYSYYGPIGAIIDDMRAQYLREMWGREV